MTHTPAAAPDQTLRAALDAIGQGHVFRFWDELSNAERASLTRQIESLPIDRLPTLVERYVTDPEDAGVTGTIEPAVFVPRDPEGAWDPEKARASGDALLKAGKVACFTVAGGQGSRLGYDGPKGCFPVGAVSGKPLFQVFAEQILAATRKYGKPVPWFIMTSPLNHGQTVAFFEEHNHFGLPEGEVHFFQQGVMPSMDKQTGNLLLAGKAEIATNPDGHGGSLLALWRSGALAAMRDRGIEQISYFQVDNPHARAVDPVFLGLHTDPKFSSGQMSSKMVRKADAGEKVGVFAQVGGRTRVLEYSDMPKELSHATDPHGELLHLAGSIAIHLISVAFVETLNSDERFELPYHRAVKKVPFVDLETGKPVSPEQPNGVKLERFVFDALPMCEKSLVYEADRVEEFAPVKNATGVDSVETSKELQTERAARWLTAVGIEVPRHEGGTPDCVIEISPLTACEARDLRGKDLPRSIERGATIEL